MSSDLNKNLTGIHDHRAMMKKVIVVTAIAACGFLMIGAAIFLTVNLVLQSMSLEKEKQWFSWFDDAVDGKVVTNPLINDIYKKAGVTEAITVKIMCDKHMNAFAWPGGNIVLTSELFRKLNTEEGLAFVVGHEMGHIKNRDHLKGMARSMTVLIADMIVGLRRWPGSEVIVALVNSAYSRDQELAADSFALQQMKTSYGHTKGGDEFFLAIQSEPQEKINETLWFLGSHPLTSDRLKHFEDMNKDFLSERTINNRRDLFDAVLCESGCDEEACKRERSGSPKSSLPKGKKPITLKDPSVPPSPSQTPAT